MCTLCLTNFLKKISRFKHLDRKFQQYNTLVKNALNQVKHLHINLFKQKPTSDAPRLTAYFGRDTLNKTFFSVVVFLPLRPGIIISGVSRLFVYFAESLIYKWFGLSRIRISSFAFFSSNYNLRKLDYGLCLFFPNSISWRDNKVIKTVKVDEIG